MTIKLSVLILALSGCADESSFTGKNSATRPAKNTNAENAEIDPMDGSGDAGGTRLVEEEFETAQVKAPVDVVFAVDTSGSMNEERAAIEANMKKFMEKLGASNVDARVIVVGTGFTFPSGLPQDKFAVVPTGIGSIDAIGVLTRYFKAGAFPLQLRPEANMEVVIVTDDNGRNYPPQYQGNLAEDFVPLPGKKTIVNSIVGLKKGLSPTNSTCNIVNVGSQYIKLSEATGGLVYDLCEKNWEKLFQKVSEAIIVNSVRPMTLKHIPVAGESLEVFFDGVPVDPSNYEMSPDGRTLIFKGRVEKPGKMRIRYPTSEN